MSDGRFAALLSARLVVSACIGQLLFTLRKRLVKP